MIALTIPVRTVSEANQREHWARKAKRAKGQRLVVGAFLRRQDRRCIDLPAVVTLTRVAPRSLDTDNLQGSQKHVRDEVAAWLGVDDRHTAVVEYRYAQRRGAAREYAVEVVIAARGDT